MKTRALCLVVPIWSLLAAASVTFAEDPPWPNDPDVAAVVSGNNQFAFDLYETLAGEEEGNLFFSPYSVSTALAMTYAGARGNTETQMGEVLHFPLSQDRLHPAFGNLIGDLNGSQREGYQLNVANRLWGQEGYDFLPAFLDTTRQHYGAELAQVDFIWQTEQARQTINTWVEDQTQQKIKDLLPSGALNPLTRLVLTNAIYFKGDWKYQFDPDLTEEAPFAAPGEQLNVAMMHQVSQLKHAALPSFQMLEMPYTGEDLSMLVLLPNELDGLAGLESWLTAERLDDSIDQLWPRDVSVSLPKFEITYGSKSLKPALLSMGMLDAFAPYGADFSGMNGRKGLFISDVFHKAFIDVNEEGTEAAAATGVVIGITSFLPPPVEFYADHPFLFLIRDNTTESILFFGRVMEPETSAGAAVPEPSTLVGLLSTGALGLLAFAWRRRKRAAQG